MLCCYEHIFVFVYAQVDIVWVDISQVGISYLIRCCAILLIVYFVLVMSAVAGLRSLSIDSSPRLRTVVYGLLSYLL